ncbi:unnamed protein product, partial [Polarella glacialis]
MQMQMRPNAAPTVPRGVPRPTAAWDQGPASSGGAFFQAAPQGPAVQSGPATYQSSVPAGGWHQAASGWQQAQLQAGPAMAAAYRGAGPHTGLQRTKTSPAGCGTSSSRPVLEGLNSVPNVLSGMHAQPVVWQQQGHHPAQYQPQQQMRRPISQNAQSAASSPHAAFHRMIPLSPPVAHRAILPQQSSHPSVVPAVMPGQRPYRHTVAHPGGPVTQQFAPSNNGYPQHAIQHRPHGGTHMARSNKAPLDNIIRSFEQAMTRSSQSSLSSSLRELDEASAARLADLGETSPISPQRSPGMISRSTCSLNTGMLSRSATALSIPLSVRSPRLSQSGPQRQASGPSLKALANLGGNSSSPRGSRSNLHGIMRSFSASVGLDMSWERRTSRSNSPPGTPREEASTYSIPEPSFTALGSPWEQYKQAARRAKLLQHQLTLATAEAAKAAAMVRHASVAESVPDSYRSAGASSSGGSVGSKRMLSARRLTPRTPGEEEPWLEQRDSELE